MFIFSSVVHVIASFIYISTFSIKYADGLTTNNIYMSICTWNYMLAISFYMLMHFTLQYSCIIMHTTAHMNGPQMAIVEIRDVANLWFIIYVLFLAIINCIVLLLNCRDGLSYNVLRLMTMFRSGTFIKLITISENKDSTPQ